MRLVSVLICPGCLHPSSEACMSLSRGCKPALPSADNHCFLETCLVLYSRKTMPFLLETRHLNCLSVIPMWSLPLTPITPLQKETKAKTKQNRNQALLLLMAASQHHHHTLVKLQELWIVCQLDCRAARLPRYAQRKPGVKQAGHTYLVHEGLRERGLINFVVAMLAVAHNVHHYVALPLLAPLRCQLTSTHLQLSIVTIITITIITITITIILIMMMIKMMIMMMIMITIIIMLFQLMMS